MNHPFYLRAWFVVVVLLIFGMLAVLASPADTAPHSKEEAVFWP